MKTRLLLLLALGAAAVSFAAELPSYAPDANAPRAAIPAVYRWDLSPLFASDQAFEQARTKLLAEAAALAKYEGKLAEPATLTACLDLYFRLHRDANFLTLYANMRQSTARSDDAAAALSQRSLAAMDELMRAATFIRREVLALPTAVVTAAYAQQPALAPYRAYLDNLRRRASHVLSADGERALSLLGDNLWA